MDAWISKTGRRYSVIGIEPAEAWDGVCRDPEKDCRNCVFRKWCDDCEVEEVNGTAQGK